MTAARTTAMIRSTKITAPIVAPMISGRLTSGVLVVVLVSGLDVTFSVVFSICTIKQLTQHVRLSHPAQLSLAIPPWVGTMSSSSRATG